MTRRTRTSGGRDNHNYCNIVVAEEASWSWRSRDAGDRMIANMGGLGLTPQLRGGRKILRMSERKKLLKIKE